MKVNTVTGKISRQSNGFGQRDQTFTLTIHCFKNKVAMIRTPLQSTNQRYPVPLCTIIDIMKIVALEKRFVSSRGSLVSVNRLIQEIETNDGNFVFCIH